MLEAIQSDRARTAVSLSALDADGESEDRGVPVDESGYDEVEARLFVAGALDTLDDRDRLVLRLRFEEGLSQSRSRRASASRRCTSRASCDVRASGSATSSGDVDFDEL